MTANPPPPALPTKFHPLATELRAYYHELPRLLKEGEEGRYVVVKGETLHGTWDTFRDARMHGGELFGMEPFLAQIIDPRFLAVLEQWFGPLPVQPDEDT